MEVNMQTKLGHLQFGIDGQNRGFYRDLFTFLGWQILHEGEGVIGVGDSNHVSLWFGDATKTVANDYNGPGLNHFAIHTTTQAEVDQAAAYLTERGIPHLFDTPRHRPEFAGGDNTYYQVMFETPDRILAEVVYIGPKQ
jgi:catechol-2,3-dioxygenase